MRCFVLAIALCVGLGSTDALARDQVLVKLRDDSTTKAKPTPAKTVVRTKKKQSIRRSKAVAKKPKAKAKAKTKSKPKAEDSRPRPMP